MSSDLLEELLTELEAPQSRLMALERLYTGTQDLAFMAPEARAVLGNRLGRMAVNIPRLAVTSLAERCRITGVSGPEGLWDEWVRLDLDVLSGIAHREALAFGSVAALVWADDDGRPTVSIESRRDCAWLLDPRTHVVTSACKRWSTKTETHVMVFLADRVEHWVADTANAVTAGSFKRVEALDNPLGCVVLVPIINADRLIDDGMSELDDLEPLVNALNKVLADMMVSSEVTALPRRFASGISPMERPVLDENGDPVLDGDGNPVTELVNPLSDDKLRVWISEDSQSRFGQLDAGSLAGFESAVRILLTQIQAVSALPGSMLGVLADQPTSADSLRASESALTGRAEARQHTFSRAWEQILRLVTAVRDGVDPSSVDDVRVLWCDPGTTSESQAVDAAVKLFQSGLLSRSGTLKRLGYDDAAIAEELENTRQDATLGADVRLGRFMTSLDSK